MSDLVKLPPGDRILISRTDRVGNLILALPLVETIKKRYPECQVDVLASLNASPILENNSSVDKIIRVQNDQLMANKLYRKDFLHRLKMNNYQVVVVLFPHRLVSRAFHRAAIPVRIGTVGRFHSVFFNRHLLNTRKANKKHECQYNLDFLKFFRSGETVATPQVYLSEKDLRNARRILGEVGVGARFVLMHPCSSDPSASWPLEKFELLANELSEKGLKVVIAGTAEERQIIDQSLPNLTDGVSNIAGETDLRTATAVISLAQALVANATGPIHLAAAVKTPVVGLYPSSRLLSPVRWGPLGENNIAFRPASNQSRASESQAAMATIEPGQIIDALVRMWQEDSQRLLR